MADLDHLYKFSVEYVNEIGKFRARFTKEKHARKFYKEQKNNGVKELELFALENGTKKPIKVK